MTTTYATITDANADDLIYLASPYSHVEPSIRHQRFLDVVAVAAQMMNDGVFVYSPIAHTHPMAVSHKMPLGWEFWARYDEAMIRRCNALWVLMLDGWRKSVGVNAEMEIARRMRIPIHFISFADGKYQRAVASVYDTTGGERGEGED